MAVQSREKFATQVNSEILRAVREWAKHEGHPLQRLIEEALVDLLEKRRLAEPRAPVMATYQVSHEAFAPLYRKLTD